jgi:hypothetical protein
MSVKRKVRVAVATSLREGVIDGGLSKATAGAR